MSQVPCRNPIKLQIWRRFTRKLKVKACYQLGAGARPVEAFAQHSQALIQELGCQRWHQLRVDLDVNLGLTLGQLVLEESTATFTAYPIGTNGKRECLVCHAIKYCISARIPANC